MTLTLLDWLIVAFYFAATLAIGVALSRRAGRNTSEFFLSGRHMPWWLLGTSMVATTFSAGAPNFVTNLIRDYGVAGNWLWWCFLPTGMLTTFLYAKLWRRSGVLTDIEFYEIRYSGKPAAFLRGFRALYLGVGYILIGLATANLATIKIAGVMLGSSPTVTLLIAGLVTVVFSMMGGLKSVLVTDFLLFVVAMVGSIVAAAVLLNRPEIGGLSGLLANEAIQQRLAFFPALSDRDLVVTLLVIPFALQWWSVWYPGSEPGGGGYVAQRMLAARNETHATGASLLFNVVHYGLRPWPWIIVGLITVVLYPDVQSLRAAFPHIPDDVMRQDAAYPAALTLLPTGLRGLLLAGLFAAYMSTVSTLLNLGSSYTINDFYRRFLRPNAHEREYVRAGRATTVLLMLLGGLLGLLLKDALQAFNIMLQVGAGTGLLFLLRWFWWRINAFSEIAAMIASLALAIYFEFLFPETLSTGTKMILCVGLTTLAWIAVTFVTRPTDAAMLRRFYRLIRPGGIGWQPVGAQALVEGEVFDECSQRGHIPLGLLCSLIACIVVYSLLIATGCWIFGQYLRALVLTIVGGAGTVFLLRSWRAVAGRGETSHADNPSTAPNESSRRPSGETE